MACTKLSSSNVIVLSLLFLCLLQTVLSLKCYYCTSFWDKDCQGNPQQERFVTDCSIDNFDQSIKSLLNFKGNFGKTPNEPSQAAQSNGKCGTFNLRYKGKKVTDRLCVQESFTCEQIRNITSENSGGLVELEECNFCYSDLCNSSPSV